MKRFLLSMLAALGVALAPLPAASQDKLPMRIGFQTGDINVILMYAVNTGLFEKHGLDIKLSQFPAGPAMLPALGGERSRHRLDGRVSRGDRLFQRPAARNPVHGAA